MGTRVLGVLGVSTRDSQVTSSGSGSRAPPPLRIAVIGRQKRYWYFASNTAMYESASAIDQSASIRAFWGSVRPGLAARDRMTGQCEAEPVTVQNRAASVWLGLRVALDRPPTARTSS